MFWVGVLALSLTGHVNLGGSLFLSMLSPYMMREFSAVVLVFEMEGCEMP